MMSCGSAWVVAAAGQRLREATTGDGYLKYITVRTAPLLAGLSSGFHHPEFFELGVGEGALFRLGTMRPLVVRRYGFEVTIPAFVS